MTINHKMLWNEMKDYFFITVGLLLYHFVHRIPHAL